MPAGSVNGCNIVNNGGYAFFAIATSPDRIINATNNWWGVADSASIEDLVYHRVDIPAYPIVDYVPFADAMFEFEFPTDASSPEAAQVVVPDGFALHQNYPNPFNAATRIDFYVPHHSHVSIAIYNVLGRCVKSILDEHMPAGNHTVTWDGTDSEDRPVSSGVYFYRLTANSHAETRKMLLLR